MVMANATKLTKRTVESATAPDGKRTILWDSEVTGFGVKIGRTSRTYIVRYRRGAGGRNAKRADYTIGKHGSPWTVEQARKEAQRVLGEVAAGRDPQAAKVAARQPVVSRRFEAVAESFVEKHVASLRASTAGDYRRIVERTLIPAWRGRDVTEIDRAAIIDVIDRKATTAPGAARLTFAVIGSLFGWAQQRGLVDANPCHGMKAPPAPKARDRVLSDEEVVRVWRASEKVGGLGGAVVRFLLATGQRKGEVTGARWDDVDLEAGVWTIPGERAKNGKAHEVDLPPLALAILRERPRLGPFIFGANGDAPFQGMGKAKERLDKALVDDANEAGLPQLEPWRLHDLRRTAASGMAALGFQPAVIERVLNHVSGAQGGLVGVYQRFDYRAQRKQAVEAWCAHIEGALAGGKASNVVPLRAG
jgi:integrase